MNGFATKGAVAFAAVMTSLVTAHVSYANSNCDSYAKLTLQQAKQNVQKRCNFKGPRWSLDANRHRAWCRDVGPSEWRAELKLRNEMLSQCNG